MLSDGTGEMPIEFDYKFDGYECSGVQGTLEVWAGTSTLQYEGPVSAPTSCMLGSQAMLSGSLEIFSMNGPV